LQQEASRKLGFAPAHTMRVAQRLYEGVDIGGETIGLITYMRTDGVEMAGEAIGAIRRAIETDYGRNYVPATPRRYQTKTKNAQEAHEAIRPTDVARSPQDAKRFLDQDQAKLYELIWLRSVASQMESAELERTTAEIDANVAGRRFELRATGTVVKFDGFLTLYQEGRDEDPEDEEARRLPQMAAGERLAKKAIASDQHFTEPPPRYSEASLVKRLEELGIGRPSTYASILQVLKDRKYVRLDKRRLYPEDRGRIVVAFLESFFAKYVEYDFTARLEEQLDLIAEREINWREVLRDFWRDFIAAIDETKDLKISAVIDALDSLLAPHLFPPRADGSDPRQCPTCGNGRLSLKLSKYGAFIGCSNYPECRYTRPLTVPADGSAEIGTKVLGLDPESGLEITLRSGRFGLYLQLGEAVNGEKPRRAGLPKGTAPDQIDLQRALALLSLPREVGRHPEDGEPIRAGIGRFGPYVQHGKTYANLDSPEEVFSIGLNRAVTLIAEKRAKGPRGRRFGADPGRPLGDHPIKGGAVVAKNGRYGPYVSHEGVNATLPADKTPESVTLDEAVALIDARAERNPPAPHARPRRAKRPSPGTARHIKASSKRPGGAAAKRRPPHTPRKTTQAAE
jgi:DNA topoisomerase-1